MAAVEEAIRAYLLTKTAVTDLLGSGATARLWPDVLAPDYRADTDGAAATYEILSSVEAGKLAGRSGFVSSRFQFTTYASTRMAANALARAIKNCGIDQLKGVSSGVDIRGVQIDSGLRTSVDAPTDSTQEFRYLADFDLMVHYLEG